MPKFAATLASLLLIASSIGVNIARYPQVGRIVDAKRVSNGPAASAAETANSMPAAHASSGLNPANPNPLPASATEVEQVKPPQVAEADRTETRQSAERLHANPAIAAARTAPRPEVPILDVLPMVPVASAQGTATASNSYELRRLPPVTPTNSVIAGDSAGPDASEPYPATTTP